LFDTARVTVQTSGFATTDPDLTTRGQSAHNLVEDQLEGNAGGVVVPRPTDAAACVRRCRNVRPVP
jgi:hypothetical protein